MSSLHARPRSLLGAFAIVLLATSASVPGEARQAQRAAPAPQPKPQTRPTLSPVTVEPALVSVDDGDTVVVRWKEGDLETVRILGIDCPETRHPEHDLPYAQSFGDEARAFARGAFATATKIELVRAATVDPFGRTLGYLFLNGRNYSISVIEARLAEETVSRYGDNGFPAEAAKITAAAKAAGPLPFESPGAFRARMRDVTTWLKTRGQYPPS